MRKQFHITCNAKSITLQVRAIFAVVNKSSSSLKHWSVHPHGCGEHYYERELPNGRRGDKNVLKQYKQLCPRLNTNSPNASACQITFKTYRQGFRPESLI